MGTKHKFLPKNPILLFAIDVLPCLFVIFMDQACQIKVYHYTFVTTPYFTNLLWFGYD